MNSFIAVLAGISVLLMFPVVRYFRPSLFAARVSGALYDLGLDVKKLDSPDSKRLHRECMAFLGALKGKANPKVLALRFFVHAYTESSTFPERAFFRDAPLVHSVPVLKNWKKAGQIPSDVADREEKNIKEFLLKATKSQHMSKEDRLLTEIQILEL
jgi:hypothetical protein